MVEVRAVLRACVFDQSLTSEPLVCGKHVLPDLAHLKPLVLVIWYRQRLPVSVSLVHKETVASRPLSQLRSGREVFYEFIKHSKAQNETEPRRLVCGILFDRHHVRERWLHQEQDNQEGVEGAQGLTGQVGSRMRRWQALARDSNRSVGGTETGRANHKLVRRYSLLPYSPVHQILFPLSSKIPVPRRKHRAEYRIVEECSQFLHTNIVTVRQLRRRRHNAHPSRSIAQAVRAASKLSIGINALWSGTASKARVRMHERVGTSKSATVASLFSVYLPPSRGVLSKTAPAGSGANERKRLRSMCTQPTTPRQKRRLN